ncbi:MAG TPA: hypothetical protein VMN39_09825, partial [Longimicrobiaceae bacterium]|nr:hypothetical protein [Longimicrobiaceae bacterium]
MKTTRRAFPGPFVLPLRSLGVALLSVSLIPLLSTGAEAQEWTRFRGPDGAGISEAKGIPVQCDASAAAWTVTLPGVGHSSPVIWGDRVFLTFLEEGSDDSRSLACVSLKDGSTLWEKKFSYVPHVQHRFNNAASSSPCVD